MKTSHAFGFIVSFFFVAAAFWLLLQQRIAELTFISLIVLGLLMGIAIALHNNLKELDLRGMRLVLREVNESRDEIRNREKTIRKIAKLMAEITSFLAAFHRRLGSEETHELEAAWLTLKCSQLVSLTDDDSVTRKAVLNFLDGVTKMERVGPSSPEGQKIWTELWKQVAEEVEKGC